MSQRLTVAQLSARIDQIEAEFAAQFRAQDARIAQLQSTVQGLQDAQCVTERPSRHVAVVEGTTPIVRMGGRDCYKIRDPHTRVVTYRPVAA